MKYPHECKVAVITRGDLLLGEVKEKREYQRGYYITRIKEGKAKIISTHLATYQYEKARTYTPALYHVIHLPTGLVIAAIEHSGIRDVRDTFESSLWSLRGDNTFVMQYSKNLQWEFTCLLRYNIERYEECIS